MSKLRNTHTTSKNSSNNCDYHVRTLKFYQQKCAYHNNQIITNFCQNDECLLPVCPTCIKLHTDQHKMHKTSSNFQEIKKVVSQIQGVYQKMNELSQKIKKLLIDIQGNKKQNQMKIRQKLIQHRNILIKQFQNSLIQIENRMIQSIVNDDRQFIVQIQEIDGQLSKLQYNLKRDGELLHSDEMLKHIILYYSKRNGEEYERQLQHLKRRSQSLVKKSVIVTVDEGELINIRRAISRYMKIQITDWNLSGK